MKHRFGFLLFAALAACSGGTNDAAPATTNGVNDVVKACAIRAKWTISSTCNQCIAIASSPKCACENESYAGECSTQQAKVTNEPTCDGVDVCVSHCAQTDCACVDACYAGKDACRTAAAALDGCVAAACDAQCH